jgi:putative flippase GtrA
VVDRVLQSWAARSLQVGALATAIDVCVLLTCVRILKLPNPAGAAAGVAVGSTVTFFLNRVFAFRDRHSPMGPQALRFALSTLVAMVIHAGLVYLLANRVGIDVVLAKLAADVMVFSVGQLLVLRFLVFHRSPAVRPPPSDQLGSPQ